MRQYLSPRQYLRMAAASFVVLIFLLAIIQSRRGNDAGIMAPLGHREADALPVEIARCRAVRLEQTVSLETCRRLWADNRRQFFAPTKAPLSTVESLPTSATALGKIQDRLLPDAAERQDSEVR